MSWSGLLPRFFIAGLCVFCGACVGGLPPQRSFDDWHRAAELIDQGTRYLRTGELDRAEAAFSVAAELSGAAGAIDGLGCVDFLRGRLERAERRFIRAYEVDPRYAQAIANLALLYESQGLYSKAKKLYRLALQTDPGDYKARNNFAAFLADSGNNAGRAKGELLKAGAISDHPLIGENLLRMEGR